MQSTCASPPCTNSPACVSRGSSNCTCGTTGRRSRRVRPQSREGCCFAGSAFLHDAPTKLANALLALSPRKAARLPVAASAADLGAADAAHLGRHGAVAGDGGRVLHELQAARGGGVEPARTRQAMQLGKATDPAFWKPLYHIISCFSMSFQRFRTSNVWIKGGLMVR